MAENQSLAPEKLIDKLTHAAHVGDNRGLEIFAACDDEILKQLLPHCTVDQFKYGEKCLKSKGRDLSPFSLSSRMDTSQLGIYIYTFN